MTNININDIDPKYILEIDVDKITNDITIDNSVPKYQGIHFVGKKLEEALYAYNIVNTNYSDWIFCLKNSKGDLFLLTIKNYIKDNGSNPLKYLFTDNEVQRTYDIIEECMVINQKPITAAHGIEIPVTEGTVFDDIIDLRNSPRKGIEVYAYEGSDIIYGSKNNDIIYAGDGIEDDIVAGKGNDTIYGGNGKDLIDGGLGDDVIYGGKGNDYIVGGEGNNIIEYFDGDDIDFVELSKNENLTINVSGIDKDTVKYEWQGNDLYLNFDPPEEESEENPGNTETKESTKGIRLVNFGLRLESKAKSTSTQVIGSTVAQGIVGYLPPATSKSKSSKAKPYIPPFSVNVIYNGDEAGAVDLVNTKELYNFEIDSDYEGKWVNEKIDATNSTKGLTINGMEGDDTIIGSAFDDTIIGNWGNNEIIYNRQDFGNDTIQLTSGENLLIDMTFLGIDTLPARIDYPTTNYDYIWENSIPIDLDGDSEPEDYTRSLTIKDALKSSTFESAKILFRKADVEEGIEELSLDLKNDLLFNPIYITKNYKGTALSDDIIATTATKGLKIEGKDGSDRINGTDFKDTLLGGNGNDRLIGNKGNDTLTGGKGNDTYIFNSTDGSDTITDAQLGDKIVINDVAGEDLRFLKSGNNLIIYYNDQLDVNNRIIVKNYFKKNALGGLTAQNGDIDLKTANYYVYGKGNINGSSYNDIITGSTSKDTIKSKAGIDTITGGQGNDKLYGYVASTKYKKGNKTIKTYYYNDSTINPQTGETTTLASSNAKSFRFETGDGSDTIYNSKSTDEIRITCDASTVSYTKSGNNLIINYGESDKITLSKYFKLTDAQALNKIYINGVLQNNWQDTLTNNISKKNKVTDTICHDNITGTNSNDTYTFINKGNDIVLDNKGNDKYTISKSSGSLTITDNAGKDSYNINTLDNKVIITDNGGNDSLVINNYQNIVFGFNIDKYGNILSNDLRITENYNDIASVNKGVTIKNNFTEYGKIETIKLGNSVINLENIQQNIAGWLSNNGYNTSLDVIQNELHEGDMQHLIELYTYQNAV